MDKSFIFRKPTSYNLSGTVKVMLLKTLFTPFLARAKRNVRSTTLKKALKHIQTSTGIERLNMKEESVDYTNDRLYYYQQSL